MRSPVIAFSLLAAAVSPSLVSGAPASPKLDNALAQTENTASMTHVVRTVPGLNLGKLAGQDPTPPSAAHTDDPVHRTQAMKLAKAQSQQGNGPVKAAAMPAAVPKAKAKRSGDNNTAGGNAYSGAAQDSSGGDIENAADRGTLTNADGSSE
ncbi:hypothetical protein TRAPUB_4590 [Trametes pubescens]|uniref:SMP domain-containing protein n=1 Tax=Trametes pubescens TaxID=154538 RepID=A0A1M2VBA9_TRAPU|nr:hypothetical protein TRAPUB_4590 [Trametes pubescens]